VIFIESILKPAIILTGGFSGIQLMETIRKLQIKKAFIMISVKLYKDGKTYLFSMLEKEGISFQLYICDKSEPTFSQARKTTHIALSESCDGVVAIGGGSVIDLAKAVSVFAINSEHTLLTIQQESIIERLPLIVIPTTAGSGSEATKVMVITDDATGIKRNPSHPSFVPDAAILDSYWTKKLHPVISAYTGLDALTHAMEAYVSTKATELTDFYALQAFKKITNALPNVYIKTNNQQAYDDILIGSLYAGIAFSNSSTNLAHATGRALGIKYKIPHGLSVALLHPFVIDFGIEDAEDRYAEMAIAIGHNPNESKSSLARKILKLIYQYNEQFQIWETGRPYIQMDQMCSSQIKELTALTLCGNGIDTNRRIPTQEDIEKIFHQLFQVLNPDLIHQYNRND